MNEPKHDDDRQVDGEEDHRLGPVRRSVLTFFSAENARDWATYLSWLAEDVEWVCYGPQRTVVQVATPTWPRCNARTPGGLRPSRWIS